MANNTEKTNETLKHLANDIHNKVAELNTLIEKAAKERLHVSLRQQYVDEEHPNFERPAIIDAKIFTVTYSSKDEYPFGVLKSFY